MFCYTGERLSDDSKTTADADELHILPPERYHTTKNGSGGFVTMCGEHIDYTSANDFIYPNRIPSHSFSTYCEDCLKKEYGDVDYIDIINEMRKNINIDPTENEDNSDEVDRQQSGNADNGEAYKDSRLGSQEGEKDYDDSEGKEDNDREIVAGWSNYWKIVSARLAGVLEEETEDWYILTSYEDVSREKIHNIETFDDALSVEHPYDMTPDIAERLRSCRQIRENIEIEKQHLVEELMKEQYEL